MLQIICIAVAFSTAGLFLKDAFHGWNETPVITTLDSIAEPISMIQFPTVTICQDEYKPPDNWAFLETVLNNVAIECNDDEYNEYETCKKTIKLREDFDNLINSVVNTFKGWLMNPTYKATAVYDVLTNRPMDHVIGSQHSLILNDLESQILSLMENDKISKTAINDLISKEKFAKTNSIESVLTNLSEDIEYDYYSPVFLSTDYDVHTPFSCNTTKCKENAKDLDVAIRFLFIMQKIEPQLRFGSLLASFAHITDKIYNLQNIFHWIDLDCKEIETKKLKMHQYFEQISKIAGFSENELVSLYDLPAIIGNLNLTKLLDPSFQQSFLFTRCREISDWDSNEIRRSFQQCLDSYSQSGKH